MKKRFSLFKFLVGFALVYYGLKALHALPADWINFVDGLVGGLLGNLWGLILVFLGIGLLLRSIYSRTRVNVGCCRNWQIFTDEREEKPR